LGTIGWEQLHWEHDGRTIGTIFFVKCFFFFWVCLCKGGGDVANKWSNKCTTYRVNAPQKLLQPSENKRSPENWFEPPHAMH
jgi:hypothetical protein